MLIDIDTAIQMHNLTNSFNTRYIGSLVGETTDGILQSLHPNSQVSIKARDVSSIMSSVVGGLSCMTNPNRCLELLLHNILMDQRKYSIQVYF